MSADKRSERYEWDDVNSLEIHTQGTGPEIDIDKLMSEPDPAPEPKK